MFDVIIAGGGLVGTALAAALRGSGRSVALIEGRPPQSPPADDWDARVYAVSPGSQAFLSALGAWQRLDAARLAPIRHMSVYGDAGARLEFDHWDAGRAELGWIVEAGRLQEALWRTLDGETDIARLCPAAVRGIHIDRDAVAVTLDSGRMMLGRLLVGADGGQSMVREAAGLAAQARDYRQLGVVAHFETAQPHRGIARQWFADGAVLAFLPLPGNRISMVWSLQEARAHELLALPADAFARTVATAAGGALGPLRLASEPRAFALRLVRVPDLVAPRVALAGDAAHGVHPLAGQGVNLGFQDARILAEVLRDGRRDCGELPLLKRYARARKEDILAMQVATDGLQRLFAHPSPGARWLRNAGLNFAHQQSWLRRLLVRHAVG